MKKLLTLIDLYNYYSKNNESIKFDSEVSHGEIIIQLPSFMNFEDSDEEEDSSDGLLKVHLQSCHIDKNLNGSNISEDSMNDALSSFANRPILGFIHDVDGKPEFYAHNIHKEDDEIVYDEIPVGSIPESCNASIDYDEEKDKFYVNVDGYIWEEYSKAAEILQREGECPVSVELAIKKLSQDAKEKVLNIEKFYFNGVTILGKDEDGNQIKPGMEGANIKLADFSKNNNSYVFSANTEKLIEAMNKLETAISVFNKNKNTVENSTEKGGCALKFEELLEKYGKTAEDIDFEYKNMTDEELEAKFAEKFGTEADTSTQNTKTDLVVPQKYSITMSDGSVKEFALSYDDIRCSLSNLVNAMYGESDDTYYGVTVYEDETLIMESWKDNSAYRQSYSREGNNFSLTGDRVPVHQIWVTDDEDNNMQTMKNNYSSMETEIANYRKIENANNRAALLKSEDYALIADADEVKAIVSDENKTEFEQMSCDDLKKKLDSILLEYAKKNKFSFANESNNSHNVPQKKFTINETKKKTRYGNIFN